MFFTLLHGSPMTLARPQWMEDACYKLSELYADESRQICLELTEHVKRRMSDDGVTDVYRIVEEWVFKSPCLRDTFVFDSDDLRHAAVVDLIRRTIRINPEPIEDEPFYTGYPLTDPDTGVLTFV